MKLCVRIILVSFLFFVLAEAGIMARTLPDTTEFAVVAEEQRQGYTCFLIEYGGVSAAPAVQVSGSVSAGSPAAASDIDAGEDLIRSYLLVPDGLSASDKRSGLVLLHDHGARFDIGKEKLVRPLAESPRHIRRSSEEFVRTNFDGVYFADSLASLGYVVIVPDMLYWGSRSTEACREWSRLKYGDSGMSPDEADPYCGQMAADRKKARLDSLKKAVYEGQRTVYDSLAATGVIWAEKTMAEDALAARILSGLDFVDPGNIAAFGWSMGAHRTWLLTAFCQDIKTGAALCWMTLKEAEKTPYKASDYALLIPRLRDRYDFPDIALKLVPKPFLFLSGTRDHLFPVWAVEKAYGRMQSVYEEHGAEGRLRTEFFEGGHHCGKEVQCRIVEFFEKTVPLHDVPETD